ncbi:peroxidase [Xylariaceae sp. FL0662B]|nr:peroxidase [Xylariaceae sp. FL0662B]
MKISTCLSVLAATQALAYPGMDRILAEIQARSDSALQGRSIELLGDLINGASTAVGKIIKDVLQGGSAVGDTSGYTAPGELGSSPCNEDPLCVWSYIIRDLSSTFTDSNGCTDLAAGAIRQGFHDAATWDKNSAYGGADGSLLLSDEMTRSENRGLENISAQTNTWFDEYKQYGISMADLIQTAAIVATVSCPGGPRIRAFIGRKDDSRAGPTGKLPLPAQDAQFLIDLFAAKTFTASDLIALIGAHTVSKQRFVDPARAGASQDTTPALWDTRFYSETIAGDNKTIFIFHSDKSLSNYPTTKAQFGLFAGQGGQALWSPFYAQAYFRMSMLGVNNLNNLTEITTLIPLPR